MEKELTIKQLIKRTYLKIMWQFLLCLILFYVVPALLSSVSGINEKNANHFALFFSVSSWIYLCIILIFIIVINIRRLLTKIQKEMNMVYHSGLYFTKNEHHHLQIKEFIETNDLIEKIGKVKTGRNDKPVEPVIINTITLEPITDDAKNGK